MPSLRSRGFIHYRWQTGQIAWALHKLTGLLLVFYVTLHIWVIASLQLGAGSFESAMAVVSAPLFRFLEVGLLFCVIYHGLNGLRIIAIDFFGATERHLVLFYGLGLIGAVIWIWGGSIMIGHGLHQLQAGQPFVQF